MALGSFLSPHLHPLSCNFIKFNLGKCSVHILRGLWVRLDFDLGIYLDSLVVGQCGQSSRMYLSFTTTGHCCSRLHSLVQKEAVGISTTSRSGKHLGLRLKRTSSFFGYAIVGMPRRLVLQRPFSVPIVGFLKKKRLTKNYDKESLSSLGFLFFVFFVFCRLSFLCEMSGGSLCLAHIERHH